MHLSAASTPTTPSSRAEAVHQWGRVSPLSLSTFLGADPLSSARSKLRLNPSCSLDRVQLREVHGILLYSGLQADMERSRLHSSADGLSFPPKSFEAGRASAFEEEQKALSRVVPKEGVQYISSTYISRYPLFVVILIALGLRFSCRSRKAQSCLSTTR